MSSEFTWFITVSGNFSEHAIIFINSFVDIMEEIEQQHVEHFRVVKHRYSFLVIHVTWEDLSYRSFSVLSRIEK